MMIRYPLASKIDTSSKYVPAVATDIRKTFAEARRRLAESQSCVPLNAKAAQHAPAPRS